MLRMQLRYPILIPLEAYADLTIAKNEEEQQTCKKNIDSLVGIVRRDMGMEPLHSDDVFIFLTGNVTR